jgi:hypothetical protein
VGIQEEPGKTDSLGSSGSSEALKNGAKNTETPPTERQIQQTIDRFVHRIRDIEECARFIQRAVEEQRAEAIASGQEIKDLVERLQAGNAQHLVGLAIKKAHDAVRRLRYLSDSQVEVTFASSLFLGLFAAYDAYTGNLLQGFFSLKPELFQGIGGEIAVAEITSAKSIEELKSGILTKFVEKLRRDGYLDQFEALQKLFGIELKKFKRWTAFVEASQRRNIIAHCDGVI